MGSGLRLVLAAVALAAIGMALRVTVAHYDALDVDRALLSAQTARFGPGTRGRIAAWFADTRPTAELTWTAHPPTLFDDTVRVDLRVESNPPITYALKVTLADKTVEPADDPTRALIAEIATWAARPTSHGERAPATP